MATGYMVGMAPRPENDPELQTNQNYRCCCGSNDIVAGAKILMVINAILSVVRFGWAFSVTSANSRSWIWLIDGRTTSVLTLICIGLCWYGITQGSSGMSIPYVVILCIDAVLSVIAVIIVGLAIGWVLDKCNGAWSCTAWVDGLGYQPVSAVEALVKIIFYIVDVVYFIYCAVCINSLRNFLSDWQMRNPLPAMAMQPMGGHPGAMQPMGVAPAYHTVVSETPPQYPQK